MKFIVRIMPAFGTDAAPIFDGPFASERDAQAYADTYARLADNGRDCYVESLGRPQSVVMAEVRGNARKATAGAQ